MPTANELRRCVDDEQSRSALLAERTTPQSLAKLRQPCEGTLSQPERGHRYELELLADTRVAADIEPALPIRR